jgi:hypothetical protein
LALTADSVPASFSSSNAITSAQMKPFSKSVWMVPAACGAFMPLRSVQHFTSSSPAVKK